jgi:hypothetical protein
MAREIEQASWGAFLKEFGERNRARRTRLGVVRMEDGVEEDFWIEDGLPLTGLDFEPDGEDAPRVQIMLGGETAEARNLTHAVCCVKKMSHEPLTEGGGLEIESDDGSKTVLRFEA